MTNKENHKHKPLPSVISQHNYEEFFLLYADGELSVADKLSVEQFVQANPGLAMELDMLQQLRLPAEQMVFGNKSGLYRNEAGEITLANYEEHFLLYADNELSDDAREKTETFVLQHPSVQEEFTILKQVRLEPETIVFPAKQLLYRSEEKERPVFYMRWQRMAVAAAIMGFAVLIWTQLRNDKLPLQVLAKAGKHTAPVNSNTTDPKSANSEKDQVANEQAPVNTIVPSNTVTAFSTVTRQSPVNIPADHSNDLLVSNENRSRPIEATTEKTREDSYPAEIAHAPVQQLIAGNASAAGMDMIKADNPDGITSGPSANTDNIQPAAYKELDTETNDEKKSLLLGSLEINKDKLRGFFRKATSLFRGKAKADDDKTENHPSANTRSLK